MSKYYKIGELRFTIAGEDKILPYLYDELQSVEIKETEEADIIFNFAPPPQNINNGIYASPIICSPNELLYHDRYFKYHIQEKNDVLRVTLKSNSSHRKRKLPPQISRLLDWNYLLPDEVLAKNFMYDIFDYITQIKNFKRQQSYFHASSFVKGEKGVAVIAWGGVGKTTSMLKLVTEDHWQFLSDDLGIIDTEGYLYRSPKKMQIYAYNLENQPILKDLLLKNRSLPDRINWNEKRLIYGKKKARRRVSADRLFDQNHIAKKAKLTDALFIERTNIADFEMHSITAKSLSKRAATTVMDEINPYQKIEAALYTSLESSILPNYNTVFKQTQEILNKAFSNAELRLIKIPSNASPDQLADYLRKVLE